MNKYQEPLDCIKRFYVESEHYDEENINLLQELVNKATPKKVKKYACRQPAAVCSNCYCSVNKFMNKYCSNCGQKLDWSDEDDKN